MALALDVAFTDPTSKTALAQHSHKKPLVAAKIRHDKKMEVHRKALEEAGVRGLQFEKKPLVFETTGAMGVETKKWWKSVVGLYNAQREPGEPTSRRELGLDHTWSANHFSTFWLQTLSFCQAVALAESVDSWVSQHAPCVDVLGNTCD